MFPKTLREFVGLAFWISWVQLGFFWASGLWQTNRYATIALAIAALASTMTMLSYWAAGRASAPVDIWGPQLTLMKASNQCTPLKPQLTNDSLLYIFLIMEELSEFAYHTEAILMDRWSKSMTSERANVLARVRAIAEGGAVQARMGRDALAVLEKIRYDLKMEEASDLLDDSTDVAVVTAGLGIATGLPVREGYHEVATSNLSKRNPDTGRIDKHPDGKWIKGRNYKAPSLAQHLIGYYMDR